VAPRRSPRRGAGGLRRGRPAELTTTGSRSVVRSRRPATVYGPPP
jgi:hypothetical protein